ncbi:hypothetical protein [Pseudoxanthomonas sp.]|uniref:hypothetical protein n=1 Tax=Pseudoxanthomonas sp. TaxID=1871049 RepID=UPI003F7FE5DC
MATDSSGAFGKEFLEAYLKLGLGSMTKSDIDALVMWLLDRHGHNGSGPLSAYSNQTISERLRTPVAKVKKLRYEAALKFGASFTSVEDMARARLLYSLSTATFELEHDKICLIIEDALVKYWLQGQLKINRQIFDHPFNTEILRLSASALFDVLSSLFDAKSVDTLRADYAAAEKIRDDRKRADKLKKLAEDFAGSAAKAAGKGVVNLLMPVPAG